MRNLDPGFLAFSLVFRGKSKQFSDPGWNSSLYYHTDAPLHQHFKFSDFHNL